MTTRSRCYADGCNALTPSRHLMCARHWALVPPEIQAKVNRTARAMWRGGSTREWLAAAQEARAAVAASENGGRKNPPADGGST